MTKFIDSDYTNGISYLKVSVMNTLHAIDNGELEDKEYEIMPLSLVLNCIETLKWPIIQATYTPSEYFVVVKGEHNNILCSLLKMNDHLVIKKIISN